VVKILFFILAAISFLNAISLSALQAWWMSLLSLALALILANFARQTPFRFLKKLLLVICLCIMVVVVPVTLNQLTIGIRHLGNLASQNGPESLSYVSRFGLWWSAIGMSIGGVFYGAPYTVAEQVLMFWPGKKERMWVDDFPTKAQKVRNLIKQAKNRAGLGTATFKYDLLWKSYCQDHCDVGLALNGGDLTVDISDKGQNCTAIARVSVSYGRQYRGSTILGYGKYRLKIDQAAYWALQELGWLHPFTLRYKWKC
jgi:hypothetical protein